MSDVPVDRASKRQRLAAIERTPGDWQLCCGCEALVSARRVRCPHCAAYRFETDPRMIVRAARQAARRSDVDLLPG